MTNEQLAQFTVALDTPKNDGLNLHAIDTRMHRNPLSSPFWARYFEKE
jgi:hypothetical protein